MRTTILEKGPQVRRALLLGLVVGVPVLFLRFANEAFNTPKLTLLMIGVATVAAIRLIEITQGASAEGLKRMLIPAAAIALPLFIAWLFSPYRGWAVFGLYGRYQGLVPYLAVILFGLLIADAFAGRLRTLAWGLVAAGAVCGGYALMQVAQMDPFTWRVGQENEVSNAALSTTGNSNFTGGFLAIMLPVALALWFVDRERRKLVRNLGLLILGGWIVSFSQGAWAAGIAGLAIIGGFLLSDRWRWARRAGAALAAAVVAVVIGTATYGAINFESGLIPITVKLRGEWWHAASKMTADYPIVGRGPNSFVAEGVRYRSPEEANETNFQFADDPHSVFFALAAGAGILGALGYLVVAGWALRRGVALDKDNLLGAAFAAAVTAYLVQSLVSIDEITLRAACWASLGGLAAAAVPALHDGRVKKVAPTRKRRQAKAPPKQPLRLAPLVPLLALIPIAALWYGANFLLADIRVLHGKNLFNNNQIDDAKQTFARVLDFRGDNFIYRQSLGHRLGQAAYEAGAEGSTEDAEALLEDSKKAFSYFDDFPHVLGMVDQARILHALGEVFPEELEASSETYARAMNIDPINPLLRVELARVLRVAGEHERSLAVLEPVVDEVDPTRYPEFWGNLALAEANTQRYVESLDDIERALSLDPKQPEAQAAITVLERNPAAIKALKQFQEQGSEDKAD